MKARSLLLLVLTLACILQARGQITNAKSEASPKPVPDCHRCGWNKATDWLKAIPLAHKRVPSDWPQEFSAMRGLILREHGWAQPNRLAVNKRSGAYGLGQFLDATWKSVGVSKTSCTVCQIEGIYRYCHWRKQYGSVGKALAMWDARGRTTTSRSGHRRKTHGWY